MRNFLSYGAAFVLCFLCGVYGVTGAQTLWRHYFPEVAVVSGNYESHLQAAGATVVLYGTERCPYCIQARDFLRLRGVSFADLRVDTDAAARARLQSLGSDSVPVLLIGHQMIRGFHASAIDAALKSTTTPKS